MLSVLTDRRNGPDRLTVLLNDDVTALGCCTAMVRARNEGKVDR